MSIQHFSVVTGAAAPLAATIAPSAWTESFTNGESPQSKGFEANPTGGNPGYTYSWALVGSPPGLSFNGGTTSKTCSIQASGSDVNRSGTLRCTVTDALTNSVQKDAAINVTFGTPP